MVGKVAVGGDAVISIQSMTNTITSDVKSTIKQILDLENAGADIVRVSCLQPRFFYFSQLFFLDWKAYQYQNPGKKIRHALILQSDEFQLGKGSLFDVHRDILGHGNTRKIELEEALDKGKGFLINAITVLIDEAKSSGSWSEKAKLINTLKTIISLKFKHYRFIYN